MASPLLHSLILNGSIIAIHLTLIVSFYASFYTFQKFAQKLS